MGIDTLRNTSVQDDSQPTRVEAARLGTNAIWAWAFALSALALWSSSLTIYSAGAGAEFARITSPVFLVVTLSMTTVLGAIFLVARALGKLLKVGRPLGIAAFWFASYASLTATIFPLPQGVGMTRLADYGTSWTNLVLGVLLATAATPLLRTKARIVPLVAFLAISISAAASPSYGLLDDLLGARKALPVLSGHDDIVVLSFDGIQSDVFSKTIQQHPDIVNRLKDFRRFDNIIASSPATHASLTGVLAGNRNFKADAQTTDDIIALARAKGIPNRLAQKGYRVSGYGPYSHVMLPKFDMTTALVRGNPRSELAYLLQLSASRHLGPQLVTSDFFTRSAFAIAKRVSPAQPSYEHSISAQIDRGHGPDWDRSLLRSWDDFVTYRENLHVRGSRPAAHFLHFTFTHHPVDFDSTCTFRSEDKDWYDAHQSYAGLLGESECAVRSMEALLARLDEIGAYDDNLIVIMSDHGAPVQWNEPDKIEGRKIRGNADWGFGRYLPILMVKLPREQRDAMEHDFRPAILDDLALSICKWVRIDDCADYRGMDLFDPDSHPTEGYFINIVSGATANFMFETHETIHLNRSDAPLSELANYLSARDRPQDTSP